MKRVFILAACACFLFGCNNDKKDDAKTTESTMSATADKDSKPQATEFADAKYMDLGKKMSAQMSSGDIDGWLSNYSDKAAFRWSSGDSLIGKDAIGKYWKERRNGVIDSIAFLNDIWMPIKVNTSQNQYESPGVWLLSWYMVNVKYKNGKRLMFWVHADHHFDANDKIDETVQYIDRAPINAAVGHK